MRIGPKIKADFPRVDRLLAFTIPRQGQRQKVVEMFSALSELDEIRSAACFRDGTLPIIDCKPMADYGETNRDEPERVWIARDLCEKLQALSPMHRDSLHLSALIEQTALHEMVHWADLKNNGSFHGRSGPADIGAEFEYRVFGRVLHEHP
ncbi:hypothetical protein [Vannielia litorea]|uniref:hypothetical protein n=1 Tax=Vannielia litorea TaxID=1217970 RepID=UPI001BCAFA2F|nr:hypothetical protein [Vannielia litorea]